MRRTTAVVAATASTIFGFAGAGTAQAEGAILNANTPDAIAGSYLVALNDSRVSVSATAHDLAAEYGGTVGLVYPATLHGFSVRMSEAQAKHLAADPAVRYVEQNARVEVAETWGLDRVDQRDLPLDNSFGAPNNGSGTTAYIVDTGVDMRHSDFSGRITSGRDFIDNDNDASDCHGHGTHVAGTVGGTTWGVAKKVKLVAVRVLDCGGTGSWEAVIGGIDYVTQNAPQAAVGNMSLSGERNTAVNDTVKRSTDAGVAWAIAAGNNNGANACNFSPASEPTAMTVAASDIRDARASFSNTGNCVDLFAPGVSIESARNGGGSTQMSGTSMASPHVAGAAALVLTAEPAASPAQVSSKIVDTATPGKITSPGSGTPNKLLYVKDLGGGTQPGNPTASFTANCSTTEPSCAFDATGSNDPNGSIASYAWTFGDGQNGTGINPNHTYGSAGTYTVELTVTDNDGKTDTETKQVQAGAPPAGQPPQASFTVFCSWAKCDFNGTGSNDPDRDIATYAWTFGDGQTGTGPTASHTYPNRQATYTAELKVTDRTGNSNTVAKQIQCWSFGSLAFCFSQ